MLKGILVMSCIRPCVQLFMGLALCIADKSLGRNGQQIGMLMYPDDLCSAVIDNYGYYCLCVCLTVCWCFHLLGLVWWGEGRYTHVNCPACRTTLIATRFRVAVICPIIQVPHCIRFFFYFVWFVFINHIFQFYYELCTYCNILDIHLS